MCLLRKIAQIALPSRLCVALQGDNDPVDVVEIGGRPMPSGAVFHVKFLGAFAMIDGGELDWKIICIDRDTPLAAKLDTITDVERCVCHPVAKD